MRLEEYDELLNIQLKSGREENKQQKIVETFLA